MPNLDVERNIISRQFRVRMHELYASIFNMRQPIEQISMRITGADLGPERAPVDGFEPVRLPVRWGGFDQTTWFHLEVTTPENFADGCLVALIRPHGESLAYVNGMPAQGLDPNRDLLILSKCAQAGETFTIDLESVPSVRFDTHQVFEYADIALMDTLAWDLFWDLRAYAEACQVLPDNYAPRMRMLDLLDKTIKQLDVSTVLQRDRAESMQRARTMLCEGMQQFAHSYGEGILTLTGHSHIDTAWLWPLRETERKCGRTFSTMLNLMERYPEFHFSCSQPAQYEYIMKNYPELYKRIRSRIQEGRWEPNGCFWVEPDLNVPSGEALVRQTVYGNRFFRKEFGIHSRVAWTPDTFGYCWALPQILKKAQVDYFVTTKLHWNSYTAIPYSHFMWEGNDGSRIRAVLPCDYNGDITPKQLRNQWERNRQKDKADNYLFPFGFGDGGGGPTAEMIEMGRRYENIVGLPQCRFGTVSDCLDGMAEECPEDSLPIWNGELYFELHRGCQTSQARTKRNNRKSEIMLHDAEFLGVMASLFGGVYNQEAIYDAWKIVLTNQFHDILPGSSINEVYRTADAHYAQVRENLDNVKRDALTQIGQAMDTTGEGQAVLVVNTSSVDRCDCVLYDGPVPEGDCMVHNGDKVLLSQHTEEGLLIDTGEMPAYAMRVLHIHAEKPAPPSENELIISETEMENAHIRIEFDKDGCISRVYDKDCLREVVPAGEKANALQLFEDLPCDWEAWDIDFNFEEKMRHVGPPESVKVIEKGPLRGVVRMIWRFGMSVAEQDIILYARDKRIDFRTKVDWHERRTLLKAAFPTDIRSRNAVFEVQFAAVERPTHNNREADCAQFETPAHRWADLSEGDYGVALLNDCKYGYDVKGSVLRISLLRSPMDPDPYADLGQHEFTYSLYPHMDDWWAGDVICQGIMLNMPMLSQSVDSSAGIDAPLSFIHTDSEHVVIDTVKRAEDSDSIIVRLYEACGRRGDVSLHLYKEPVEVTECDLMEENDTPIVFEKDQISLFIRPFEIRTLKIKL